VKARVAVVGIENFDNAIDMIGGIKEFDTSINYLTIKVGIYNPETKICTTPKTINSVIDIINNITEIKIVESDSGAGLGLERLKIWNECFNERVSPFNLSEDEKTSIVKVAGEDVSLSHVLFKPNIFFSTHVPRRYEESGDEDLMNLGSIIKNLLGLVPDVKKYRFHNRLPTALLDMYEAIGGIDLAILDGTKTFLGYKEDRISVPTKVLIVGKDAFAVEAVGAHMVGFEPTEMPVLKEAEKRGLGEINLDKIEILGDLEVPKRMIAKAFKKLIQKTPKKEKS
jgi:uncharacterized protein (DUF362 family)